jgi:AcrR family transcriptional regulator
MATKKEVVSAFRTREIIAAARQVMTGREWEAITMEEIAQAAGVAKGTIYLYFQGKEDLLRALLSQVGENLLADIQAITASDMSPWEKLARAVSVHLEYLKRERALFPLYMQMPQWEQKDPQGWRHLRSLQEKYMAELYRVFTEGMVEGQLIQADPRLLTFLLRGMVRAVGYYLMSEGRENTAPEARRVLLTILHSGVIPPQAPHHLEEAKI